MESTTPTTEVTLAQCQKPTPDKARIDDVIDFLESEGMKGKKGRGFPSKRCVMQNRLSNTAIKQFTNP